MIGNKQHYVIAGGSGLVGSALLNMLLANDRVGKVTALVRSPLQRTHPKLSEKRIDFDTFTEKDLPPQVDAVFCCLGTTRANAGSKDAFKTVDYDYVVKLAVFTQRAGIPQFHVISAMGADMKSRLFYNQVKGRMENELHKLTKIRSIYIYRPSLLLGQRSEFRTGERIGQVVMQAFSFLIPQKRKAIHAAQVAYAMLYFAFEGKKGIHVVDNAAMQRVSK